MAVRNDFTAGEVLAAADLNDTFASKVDYALPVNAQTGTAYTFVAADAEKLTTASNGSAVTLTIPPASSVAWPDETILRVVNYGAGAVTIDGGSGVTVTNTSSTIAQYGAAVAIRTGSDAWTVVPFGGGDIPAATVSSPAATGQYTDGGGQTWDYYTFTSSGTLTVDTAGFADVLVVGGGGAGGRGYGGGGGAGGHLEVAGAYLPAGTLTVTVGAGAPTCTHQVGANGNASRISSYYAPAGGGGGGWRNGGSDYNGDRFGRSGGSGGGSAGGTASGAGTGGIGNNGGTGSASGPNNGSGGGGGANAAGSNGTATVAGNGGAGLANSYTGVSVTRAGGGGGGSSGGTAGSGGAGGGGAGTTSDTAATAGSANTGGGGGGGGTTTSGGNGGAGGSGIVIVRVKV